MFLLHSLFFLISYTFDLIPLPRNATGYIIDNYIYRRHSDNKKGTIMFLRCRQRGCKAAATIKKGEAFLGNGEHNHLPDDQTVLRFKSALKDAARQPAARKSSLSDIYTDVRKQFMGATSSNAASRELASTLPKEATGVVAAHRARVEILPKNPRKLSEVDSVYLSQEL